MGSSVSTDVEKFTAKFNTFGLDGSKFCHLLRQSGSVVAGSFPMQIVLNETYDEADIDVFTENMESLHKYLINDAKCQLTRQPGSGLYAISNIKCVNEYAIPNTSMKIQIVCLHKLSESKLSVLDYIKESFDLDFCKIIFDGEKIIRYDNGTLETKTCTLDPEHVYYYKKKYNVCHSQEYMLSRMWQRVAKYVKRGFTIILKKGIPIVEQVVKPAEPIVEPVVKPSEPIVEPVVKPAEPAEPIVEPIVKPVEPVIESIEPVIQSIEPVVQSIEPMQERKILVVGDANVGKTTYLTQLKHNKFVREYKPTYYHGTFEFAYEDTKFMLIDYAGQYGDTKIMENIDGILIIIDTSCNLTISDYWMNKMKQMYPNKPLVVCGNKTDIINEHLSLELESILKSIKTKYAYYDISAKTGCDLDGPLDHFL